MLLAATASAAFLMRLLDPNVVTRKAAATKDVFRVVEVSDPTIDPAICGGNYPRPCDSDKRTVDTERTNHGGGDAFQHLDADPNWRRIFAGYAFGVDYRVERGHAYMLQDQKETERVTNLNQPPGNRRRRPPGATRADARFFLRAGPPRRPPLPPCAACRAPARGRPGEVMTCVKAAAAGFP